MRPRYLVVPVLAAAVASYFACDLQARGGGHMGGGGGRMGGGWSGGRSEFHGGDFRGGESRGGFEHGGEGPGRRGEEHDRGAWQERRDDGPRHDGDRRHDDNDRRHNNNNNNNNTTYNPTVNVYGGGWGGDDWGYGVAAGAITGMAMGAVMASANSDSQPATVVVEQPTTVIQQTVPGAPAYGTQVTTLPPGSQSRNVNGVVAYENNGVWYRPYFGASGVYYEVLPPPPAQGSAAAGAATGAPQK